MNAVFERDYVRVSTSARFLWMRAGLAVGVAAIVGLLLAGAYVTRNFAEVGDRVLRVSLGAGLVLLLLATPGAFATVLVHARAQNSLAVLLATPLRPLQVAWGAFGARALGMLLLVVATWPPVALAFVYGGIHASQLFSATSSVVAATLLCAAPSFAISAFAKRTGAAVVAAYLTSATLLTALAAAGWYLETARADPFAAAAVSPLHAVQAALDVTAAAAGTDRGAYVLLAAAIAVSVVSVGFATWRLRAEARGDLDAGAAAVAVRAPRPLRYENPVLDREMRAGSDRARGAGRTLLAVLVVSEAAYGATLLLTGDTTSIPVFGGFLAFQVVLLVLAAAAAGATSLAAEKESGTLDVLRVTPLTPSQIVRGKLAGLLRAQLPCLVVPVLHLAWGAAVGIVSVFAIPAVLAIGLVVVSTWAIFGMSQSLDQRDPHRAVVRTMGALGIFGLLVAGQLGIPAYGVLSRSDPYIRMTVAFGANPAAAMLIGAAAFRTGGSDAETKNLPPPTTADQVGAVFGASLWLALHAGAAAFLLRKLVHLYRTRFEG